MKEDWAEPAATSSAANFVPNIRVHSLGRCVGLARPRRSRRI